MAQKFTVPVTIKNLSSAGSDGLTVFLDQESFARLKVEAGGRITWGAGSGAGDTNLYRDAESVLKTDDTFKAAGLYVSGTQIDTTGATVGDALIFNGTKFVSASVADGGASLTVSDTAPEDPSLGDLWFNSTDLEIYVYYSSSWIQVTDSSPGVQELYELVDVLIDDPVSGETLVYNGTEWVNEIAPAGIALSLETARAISISGDASGSVLFDGSQDVNITASVRFISGTEIDPSGATVGDALVFNGTKFVSASVAGGGGASLTVSDTPPPGASEGDLWFRSDTANTYVYYDSSWVEIGASGGVATLDDIGNVSASAPASGDFLKWNGSAWVNDSIDLGSETNGIYVADLVAGTGVTITNGASESASPTIAIGQSVGTTASVTFANVTADLVGDVTGNLTGDVTGNASTATTLENARTISLAGDVSGSVSFNGSSDVSISATIQPNSVALGTDTSGDYVSSLVAGTGVALTNNSGENATPTIAIGQAVGTSASVTFGHVSAPVTGNVIGDLTGNADTATSLETARTISLGGDLSGSASFNGTSDITISASVVASSVSIDELSDVVITSAQNGQLLEFDGTNWVNAVRPSSEPMGHENKEDSVISFNEGTRTFSISPASTSFTVWCAGRRFVKTTTETVQIPDTSGLYYIYFSSSGVLSYRTTFFVWDTDAPTAYVYWNEVDNKAYFFADERHGVTLDWATHEYLHRTRGAAIANGFGVSNFSIVGNGSSDAHAKFDLAGGTFFDEDLQVDIVHSNTPTVNTWQQILEGNAEIPVFYKLNSHWVKDAATEFAFKQGTSRPKYNSYSAPNWTTTDIDNNKFAVSWIIATNNLNEPVIAIMGQASYNTVGEAEAAAWEDLNLDGFPIVEFRPLHKVVFQGTDSFTNSVNAAIRGIYDLRRIFSGGDIAIPSTPVSDHGSMTGLADDDHTQYLLADGTRNATELTITNDLTVGGNLTVNGTTTTLNTETLSIEDNIIVLNSNVSASPSLNAGIEVERGTSANVLVRWNETTDKWEFTNDGSTYGNLAALGTIALGTDTTGDYMSGISAGTGISVSHTPGEGSSASVSLNATLDDLSNVTAPSPSDGNFLKYVSASSSWVPATIPTINALDDIGDVSVTSPTVGDYLQWSGSVWTSASVSGGSTVTASTTPPSSPESGSIWFDSGTAKTYVYYDSFWVEIGGTSGGAKMYVSLTAPSAPLEGQLWFKSDTAQTFAYYDSSWIEVGAAGMSAIAADVAPASPVAGQIWFDTDSGATYVYYDSYWIEVGAVAANTVFNLVDAKGDLLVGTADNTLARQAVGTNGQLLQANSATTSGVEWFTPAYAPSASPTFTGTVTGNPAVGTTSTGTSGFGYMGLPQNASTTGSYGIVAADAGTHIYSSATRTITIPANGTIAMPVGSTIVFIAGPGATVTIAITTDTMYLAGAGTTGSRTLAAFGMATAVKITSTSWIISGNGLT